MKINVAVCDDEDIICDEIKRKLLHTRPDYDITIYHSGYGLLNSEITYDLIFLDIEMLEIDGMKTAELLREKGNDSLIIFLTSHTECMPDAFKVKAFRFLSKPIEMERFTEAVVEAEKEFLNRRKIAITEKGEVKLVSLKDILYLEAFGDGTYIYTKDEVIESNETLKYWNDKLGTEHFFQTHRSYIIALRYVTKIESRAITVKYSGTYIPVSRRRYKELKEAVVKYVREQSRHM